MTDKSKIYLSCGNFVLIDEDDYDFLSMWKWNIGSGYASRAASVIEYEMGTPRRISMHRQILSCPKGMVIDHINRNKLDNRKSNLRVCTYSENTANAYRKQRGTSKYKGVYYKSDCKKWCAELIAHGKRIYLGLHITEKDAALAYNKAFIENYGTIGLLNEV